MSIYLALRAEPRDGFPAEPFPAADALAVAIRPGQLWRIEVPANRKPAETLRRAVAEANVVVYDRDLTAIVAGVLPLGGYAEPAGESGPTAERCSRFARDGWSVVRLVAGEEDRMAIVIDTAGGDAAPRLHAVAANGLAG